MADTLPCTAEGFAADDPRINPNDPDTVPENPDTDEEQDGGESVPPETFTLCGYTFGEHASSRVPVHYLSVFLKYFLPSDYVYDQSLKQTVDSQFSENLLDLKSALREDTARFHLVGSRTEGLAIPDYRLQGSMEIVTPDDELRILSLVNRFKNEENIDESLQQLTIDAPESKLRRESSGVIVSTEATPSGAKNCCTVSLSDSFVNSMGLTNKRKIENALHRYFITPKRIQSPGWSLQSILSLIVAQTSTDVQPESEPDENVDERTDTTLMSIAIADWPSAASSWLTRSRTSQWPTEQCIESVKQNGYHLMAVENEGEQENTWVYSFFTAEATLAQMLTKDQRKCFLVLKLIFEQFLSEQTIFSYYHLKTFFLWICEFIPVADFRDTNLGCTLLTVLETLHSVVKSRKLDHYFISEINLLEDASEKDTDALAEKVAWVTQHAIDCILKLDTKLTFVHVLDKREKLPVVFASAVHTSRTCAVDESAFIASVHDGLKDLLRSYLHIVKCAREIPNEFRFEKCLSFNLMTDLLREILVDMREFEDIPQSVHNMDFMLGCLVSANKDSSMLAHIYVYLCARAGLNEESKMVSVLSDVMKRTDHLYLLRGKGFLLEAMIEAVKETNVPSDTDSSNKALYMQHFKDFLLAAMFDQM